MKILMLLSGVMCLLVAGWSVYGFGGPTLVEFLAHHLGLPLAAVAAIVSVLVGALTFVLLLPGMKSATKPEKQ